MELLMRVARVRDAMRAPTSRPAASDPVVAIGLSATVPIGTTTRHDTRISR